MSLTFVIQFTFNFFYFLFILFMSTHKQMFWISLYVSVILNFTHCRAHSFFFVQLQDVKERDLLRQYTNPPSRNGTHEADGNRTNDKGFVVKGAPWDKKKDAAPDTTNTQEFPSFGSTGDMPPKPVAWGPSRR